MLTLLLAETALEAVPAELVTHPSVKMHAKRRGKRAKNLILDSSLHHTAMKKLTDNNRRGRPDIVHVFLLNAFDSILGVTGELSVLIHTRNDQLINFKPDVRLPKNFNRFLGLMEQLFEEGRVPAKLTEDIPEPLIELSHGRNLESIVDDLKNVSKEAGREISVVVLSDDGPLVSARDYFNKAQKSSDDLLCILGGFPEGGFQTDLSGLGEVDIISIHPVPLKTWTVAGEVLVNYRTDHDSEENDSSVHGGGLP